MNHDNDEYDDAYEEEEDDDEEEAWVADDDLAFFDADYDEEDEAVSIGTTDSTQQQQQQHRHQEQSTLPLPREHSYLAGASHPLVVRFDGGDHPPTRTNYDNLSSSISSASSPPMTELAILELQGVVLFPGSTIPVKLRDPSLITYLGHQIEVCRTLPHRQPKVCLGIVTYQGRHRRRPHPNSTDLDDASSQNHQHHTHRLVGRIGTIATIQYIQERTDSFPLPVSSTSTTTTTTTTQPHIWGRYQELNELVFTAVGTGRFEVVGPTTASSGGGSVFQIRELQDVPLLPPPIGRLFTTMPLSVSGASLPRPLDEEEVKDQSYAPSASSASAAASLQHSKQQLAKHDQVIWNLSHLTPTPYFVYQRNWPWRLKDELMLLLQENQGRSNLPQLSSPSTMDTTNGTTATSIDPFLFHDKSPTQFSYWLSGNMPFTQSERLDLLEMPSTLERLRVLRQKILTLIQQRMMCYVGCTRCHNPLAPVSEIFSFEGAEGATSNYVNDHGYIHQITTLRSVLDERHLHFQGPPSTSNSYFPGYSWTITYCRFCSSLLGWKFQKVQRRFATSSNTTGTATAIRGSTTNNPDSFFGFQSASVRTMQDD